MKTKRPDPKFVRAADFAKALIGRGILFEPWARNPKLAIFQYDTVHGCADLHDPMFRIIALVNDQRGNGRFVEFITDCEAVARDTGRKLQIVQLWNVRLAEWFRRRQYVVADNPNLGLYATYAPST